MKTLAQKFALPAMAFSLLLSCSLPGWVPFFGEDEEDETSSSSNEQKPSYNYCVLTVSGICLSGPFTECKDGGLPSNECPFNSGNNQGNTPSSSSNGGTWQGNPDPSSSSIQSSGGGGSGNNIANYRTVKIGNQTWMAENLNYNVNGSKCYDNQESNCAQYGRLYEWATARTVCPSGWHLPSDAEWTTLTDFVGGESTAGNKLKATSGWNEGGNGTDAYGFSALPGGLGDSDGGFVNVGYYGYWWSSTESNATSAYFRVMWYYFGNALRSDYNKTDLISVRCVKD